MRRRLPSPVVGLLAGLLLGPALGACSSTEVVRVEPGSAAGASPRAGSTPAGGAGTASPEPDPPPGRADAAYDRMTPQQRVGQLFMIGMTTTGPTQEMHDEVVEHAGGNVFLRGQSDEGAEAVRAVTDEIAASTTLAGVRPWISADQEGGNAQSLEGEGFSDMPTGLTQGTWARTEVRSAARTWARELLEAGVTMDLAPVADVVPPEVGADNAPIGYFRREYGGTVEEASPAVGAFVRGMQVEGVATSVKHFPGLGRASGNTDSDATATDPTTVDDPYLEVFAKGIRAGTAMVMMSSAHYPAIDPDNRACFSPRIIGDMLRGDLGFDGIVLSDSFGSASVAGTPPGERAVRFLRAGGTMVLDTNYLDLEPMTGAVLAEMDADPAFAATVEAAVRLVLETKDRFGLVG